MAYAVGQIEHEGSSLTPVLLNQGHDPTTGQRPGPVYMPEEWHGRRKIVQTDKTDTMPAVVQIMDESLTLQQVAETGQIQQQNVSHDRPFTLLMPEPYSCRRPAYSTP